MNDNNISNKIIKKRAFILIILIGIILTFSSLFIIFSGVLTQTGTTADIYVDGSVYMTVNLADTDDTVIEIINSKGNVCHIQIKDHDIRMLDSDCKNHLCMSQGWAGKSLIPIVCLPNNVVISISGKNSVKGGNDYDAISY